MVMVVRVRMAVFASVALAVALAGCSSGHRSLTVDRSEVRAIAIGSLPESPITNWSPGLPGEGWLSLRSASRESTIFLAI